MNKFVPWVMALAVMSLPTWACAGANKWIKAESPHFIVYSDNGATLTQTYLVKLEQYRFLLSAFHGLDEDDDAALPKLPIYFVAGRDDLEQSWPSADANVAGYFNNCAEGQVALGINMDDRVHISKNARSQDENSSQTILFHEYAHNFMFQNSEGQFPPWYVEGFAEYYSTTRIENNTAVVGLAFSWRVYSLQNPGVSVNYASLLRDNWRTSKGHDDIREDAFYAQSWLLTHYMMADPARQAQLAAYIEAYRKGEDPVAAFEKITGTAVADLPRILNTYLNKMVSTQYGIKAMPDSDITVTDMPVSANKLLLWDAGGRCASEADGHVLMANIQREAPKFPGDDYAGLALARTEIIVGSEWDALPILKTYTTAHPNDADAMNLLGQAWYLSTLHKHIADGETADSQTKQARTALAKSYQLDPTNAVNLYYFTLSLWPAGTEPSDNAVNAAIQARNMAPSVEDYDLLAAELLVRKGRLDEAKEVLYPLSSNPHNPTEAGWVKSIISAIDSGASKEDVLKVMAPPAKTDDAAGHPKDKPNGITK